MSEATDRPQDRGRAHRRAQRTAPAPATDLILDRYRVAMRDELADTIAELRPATVEPDEPIVFGQDPPKPRPSLETRLKLWDLAIKLGRELARGEDLDPDPPAGTSSPVPIASAPRLTPAQRRALGG